jgi:hypothetical protein
MFSRLVGFRGLSTAMVFIMHHQEFDEGRQTPSRGVCVLKSSAMEHAMMMVAAENVYTRTDQVK